jgi:uncharacterized membrane protein
MSTWHYEQNHKPCGPIDAAALQQLLRVRAGYAPLPPDTLVWKEGMANWAPANTIPEFSAVINAPSAPPPLPSKLLTPPFPGSSAPPPNAPPPLAGATASAADPARADVDQNKVFAVLAYLGILFLVPLLAAPHSPFARYHTNQGVVFFISAIILHFGTLALGLITFGLGFFLMPLSWVAIIVFMIIGIVHAATGQYRPLPLIGHFELMK